MRNDSEAARSPYLNLAMHDTIDLWCELITGKEGITIHALRNLEQQLCKRAEPVTIDAEETKQMLKGLDKALEGKNETWRSENSQ